MTYVIMIGTRPQMAYISHRTRRQAEREAAELRRLIDIGVPVKVEMKS